MQEISSVNLFHVAGPFLNATGHVVMPSGHVLPQPKVGVSSQRVAVASVVRARRCLLRVTTRSSCLGFTCGDSDLAQGPRVVTQIFLRIHVW